MFLEEGTVSDVTALPSLIVLFQNLRIVLEDQQRARFVLVSAY